VASVTANELKTKGVSIVEESLKYADEVVVSVRGRDRFVIMDMDKYAKLREYELECAINEARNDLEKGAYKTYSVNEHINQIQDDL